MKPGVEGLSLSLSFYLPEGQEPFLIQCRRLLNYLRRFLFFLVVAFAELPFSLMVP